MKLKISIADDHVLTTSGIERLLEDHPGIVLTGIYHDGASLLAGLEQEPPDVLLLDIQMPDTTGDELATIITHKYPAVAILALTNMDLPFYLRTMFASGVKGYLLKSATRQILVTAIETVGRGQQYIDAGMKDSLAFELVDSRRALASPTLTRMEQKILELVAAGKTSQEMAAELFVSLKTVENHRAHLFFKLGVNNAASAVLKGIQLGLIR